MYNTLLFFSAKMELARELQVKRNQKSLPQPPNIIMYVLHISDLLRVDPSLTDLQEVYN